MIDTLHGDCRELLPALDAGSVQTIVTSPPYWRLRQYTDDPREIGQEPTPAEYVAALAAVFRECRRVLRDDGTLWLNLGDAYQTSGGKGAQGKTGQRANRTFTADASQAAPKRAGLPPKSLIGLPWRVAFALQDDGWVLRSEIIWHKPNAMPEAVTDRPTRSHEHLFLFAKQPCYFYDAAAIAEESAPSSLARAQYNDKNNPPPKSVSGVAEGVYKGVVSRKRAYGQGRNARTVWSIATTPIRDEHYAPMPQTLAERCIKAGSRPGDTVLDPFGGSGTTGRAAVALGRRAVLIDLGYQELQARRTDGVQMKLDALEAV